MENHGIFSTVLIPYQKDRQRLKIHVVDDLELEV